MTAERQARAVLLVGRFDSQCGVCGKAAWPQDKAHKTPVGYTQQPGCGAVWTHVVSTYVGAASEEAVRNLRSDLIYGTPSPAVTEPGSVPEPSTVDSGCSSKDDRGLPSACIRCGCAIWNGNVHRNGHTECDMWQVPGV